MKYYKMLRREIFMINMARMVLPKVAAAVAAWVIFSTYLAWVAVAAAVENVQAKRKFNLQLSSSRFHLKTYITAKKLKLQSSVIEYAPNATVSVVLMQMLLLHAKDARAKVNVQL